MRTNAIVAQMGHEPILKALQSGAKLVACGRAYDPSPLLSLRSPPTTASLWTTGYHMGEKF